MRRAYTGFALAFAVLLAGPARGGQTGEAGALSAGQISLPTPTVIDGPPAPVPPAVMTRDETGRTTVRAVRLQAPLRIDGRLDEGIYTTVLPATDLIQSEPAEGLPATEKTEFWVTFDDDNIYVSVRCWESDAERVVANNMRRDAQAIWRGDDIVAVIFDTFYDRRNAYQFNVNAIGGLQDAQITGESNWNGDWNQVWDLEVARSEDGWAFELAIPFKSLRYRPGPVQVWGFNLLRTNRWKNEVSFLTRVPKSLGQSGLNQVSLAGTLVGLEAPAGAKNLDIKPYATSELKGERIGSPAGVANDLNGEFGIDVKYGITQNLTADLTYNTDFAQAEADEQQANLTRFSLFFPEKREFFLENSGIFAFGGANSAGSDTPVLFYSRRIGLNQGQVVPIQAGGRLTGRVGRYTIGLMNLGTGDEPVALTRPTNFSVVRVKRDVLRRSSVGLLFTGRSVDQRGGGANLAYGVDTTLAFFTDLTINAYWAKTRTDARRENDTSYRTHLNYAGDRYGLQLERLVIDDNFNPEVGFVRRPDMRRSFGQLRFSPRPRSIASVRKFSWIADATEIENGAGRVETRDLRGEFAIEFQNSDRLSFNYTRTFEFVPTSFAIAPSVLIPVGGYRFGTAAIGFNLGPQRSPTGNILAEYGTFYSGHRRSLTISQGRISFPPRIVIEPSYTLHAVPLSEGSFTSHLLGSRLTVTMTPRMFASALIQYNSTLRTAVTNVRLRWEYQPGSELFVVYNDDRDLTLRGFPRLNNRSFIVKVNRLFRF